MIRRSLLMNNAISPETFSKFLTEFSKRSDNPLARSLDPAVAALVVDAIEFWEQKRMSLLSMTELARLYPEAYIFPNSHPANRAHSDNRPYENS